ncbi:MAG TPA: hypothetical protein VM597_18975 [Gemmataceae bacterium]|nr:hypothetical protein [Gemmataceae bacterium]
MAWTVIYGRGGENAAYFQDGVARTKDEFDAAFPPKPLGAPAVAAPSSWPMKSVALAVHPDQVAEAIERNRRNGVGVTYDATGMAEIPDRGERKKILKLEGLHDNHGGYGD